MQIGTKINGCISIQKIQMELLAEIVPADKLVLSKIVPINNIWLHKTGPANWFVLVGTDTNLKFLK